MEIAKDPVYMYESSPITNITHQTINGKYRVVFERSAVKGVDGFKVEANGDEINQVTNDAQMLYKYAQNTAFKAEG